MIRYSTQKKRFWIPMVLLIGFMAILIYITYHDFYLSATALLLPLFALPSILRSKRGDPDLAIIDTKLVIRALPINKEYELSEYYEIKITKNLFGIKRIVGYKIVDEIIISEVLVRPFYQDSLAKILTKLLKNRIL